MYIHYEDAGHSWLRVTRQELITLCILDKISGYSYQKGDYVYLEEDMDLSTFLNAKFPDLQGYASFEALGAMREYEEDSRVRNYDHFQIEKPRVELFKVETFNL